MERAKDPNKGLISPPGGKLHSDEAESPVECAVREFEEECGIKTQTKDWELAGIITEDNYPGIGHILIFLYRLKTFVNELPKESVEGGFLFVDPADLDKKNIPETDKLFIWKFVLNSDNGFFSLKIDCNSEPFTCITETS
jgi:8-oxo-dGTP pyrophosphatase MutT (NUDIX family)